MADEDDTEAPDAADAGSGIGGGGGARARPIGALEITDHATRFVPIVASSRALRVGLVGFGLGLLIGNSIGRRRDHLATAD